MSTWRVMTGFDAAEMSNEFFDIDEVELKLCMKIIATLTRWNVSCIGLEEELVDAMFNCG
jgi:hypothetical protein